MFNLLKRRISANLSVLTRKRFMLNWMRARYIDDSELYSGVIFTTRIVQPTDLEWGMFVFTWKTASTECATPSNKFKPYMFEMYSFGLLQEIRDKLLLSTFMLSIVPFLIVSLVNTDEDLKLRWFFLPYLCHLSVFLSFFLIECRHLIVFIVV